MLCFHVNYITNQHLFWWYHPFPIILEKPVLYLLRFFFRFSFVRVFSMFSQHQEMRYNEIMRFSFFLLSGDFKLMQTELWILYCVNASSVIHVMNTLQTDGSQDLSPSGSEVRHHGVVEGLWQSSRQQQQQVSTWIHKHDKDTNFGEF